MPTQPAIPDAIIEAIGGIAIAIIGALMGFHLGRPKQKAEVSEKIAAAAETTTDTALRLVKELEARMTEQETRHEREMAEIRQENNELKEQLRNLEKLPAQVAQLQRENAELKQQNAELTRLVRSQRGLGMKS